MERVQPVEVGDRVERRLGQSRVAASLAAGALGSQTGDSLYGPASAASLVTLRGTDGLESGSGIMPLVVADRLRRRDDALGRRTSPTCSTSSPAVDPDDPTTAPADRHIPADWRSVLDVERAGGQADRLHPVGVGRSVRHDRHDRRREGGAPVSSWTPARRSSRWASTVGGTDTPPTPPDSTTGNIRTRKAGCSTSTAIPSW